MDPTLNGSPTIPKVHNSPFWRPSLIISITMENRLVKQASKVIDTRQSTKYVTGRLIETLSVNLKYHSCYFIALTCTLVSKCTFNNNSMAARQNTAKDIKHKTMANN